MNIGEYFTNIENESKRRRLHLKWCQNLGISDSSLYAWRSGKWYPAVKHLSKIKKLSRGKISLREARPDL